MYDLLIFGGTIVTHEASFKGNIAVRNGKIAAITDEETKVAAEQIIDATGKLVFPGGIDCHAHFNEPGFEWREDFFHGTQSAAAGGITTVIDMPLQNKPAVTNASIWRQKATLLQQSAFIDYALWGGLVDNNIADLPGLCQAGAVGLKAFLGPVSPDYSTIDAGILRQAMEIAGDLGKPIGLHCEDYAIVKHEENKALDENRLAIIDYIQARPVSAELLAVTEVIQLAKETGARVHICHVSHPAVAQAIKEAQGAGVKITAETCPHYLVFSQDDFLEKGSLFKCAPPLRKPEEREQLWSYVIDGTISCLASDHSPCAPAEKAEETGNIWQAWAGISGVQSVFPVFYDAAVHRRHLKPELVARCLAYGPAKAFGLYPRKGCLAPGSDGDLVVFDPELPWVITPESLFYKNKLSAFVGLTGKGSVTHTVVRGNIVFANGQIKTGPGIGRLVHNCDN